MELLKAIKSRRTHRKYINKKVSHADLEKLIEYARYAPMGGNIQGIKYVLIEKENMVKEVFKHTKWSAYHPEDAPNDREQPTAYIAMLGDTAIKPNGSFETDAGASGTIISLVAEELGLASCWIGSVNKKEVAKLLELDERYELLYLIAVGYSEQKATAIDTTQDIRYFTDENGVLTVPKRTVDDIILPCVELKND